jgi:hypothetical protein
MPVEDPFYTADKRDSILSNISSMNDADKSKYDYIWKAELEDGTSIVQFDGRGEEQNYGDVREALESRRVKSLYWVPVEAGKDSFGVDPAQVDGDTGLIRRNVLRHDAQGAVKERGRVYRIEAGQDYLYINSKGDTTVCQDKNLSIVGEV